jgi:hypothetical protein
MGDSSGADLARSYFDEVVGPLLAAWRPGLPFAAGRLGPGSDVLGHDDERSRDHDWGLRLTLLVAPHLVGDIADLLAAGLPATFAGLPTRFPTTWDPTTTPKVEVADAVAFCTSRLGVDPARLGPAGTGDPVDWLMVTGQSVLEIVAGPVFTDTDGAITALRRRLAWYPDDVWRYVLASGWQRIAQELPMVGRTADVGDDLGSRLIAARLARDVVHLAFLIDRAWPPYPKWLGTRLDRVPTGAAVRAALAEALAAVNGHAREDALVAALTVLHTRQAAVGLPRGPEVVEPFYDRPYRTVARATITGLTGSIVDPAVRRLPVGVGAVEQWVDNVDVLTDPARRAQAVAGLRAAMI